VSEYRSTIERPVITEKATALREGNQYVFRVAQWANKIQIRKAIETIFRVHVESVRTVSVPSKPKRQGFFAGRQAGWKKAYVRLRAGDSIESVENP